MRVKPLVFFFFLTLVIYRIKVYYNHMKVQFSLNIPTELLDFCRDHATKIYSTPTQVIVDAVVQFKNEVENGRRRRSN